jgi:N-acyl homoserine lactone hydrolase
MPRRQKERTMRVHAVQTGTVEIKENQRRGSGRGPVQLANTLLDGRWTGPLPVWCWVVEHPEGVILVDTGTNAWVLEPGYLPGWNPYFRRNVRFSVRPEDEVGPQVRKLGIPPEEVRWVVLTHLHIDHDGGLHHFPNAEVLVGRREYDFATGLAGRATGYLPNRWPSPFSPTLVDFGDESVGPFPRSRALTRVGDVLLVRTEGHTAGHLSVIVREDGRSLFLAGDTSYTEGLMLEGAVDGVSPRERVARETLRRVLRYAEKTPTVYLPSHDPASAERLAGRSAAEAVPAL